MLKSNYQEKKLIQQAFRLMKICLISAIIIAFELNGAVYESGARQSFD